MVQDHDFSGVSVGRVKEFVGVFVTYNIKPVDFFRMYFETPFNESNYNISSFYASTSFKKLDYDDIYSRAFGFYRRCYRKWLNGLLRSVFYTGPHRVGNNWILLLTGPEQIRKTSHFRYILLGIFNEVHFGGRWKYGLIK